MSDLFLDYIEPPSPGEESGRIDVLAARLARSYLELPEAWKNWKKKITQRELIQTCLSNYAKVAVSEP